MKHIFWVGFAALMMGCASVNNSLTPSAKVITDDFDGSRSVMQAPVSAASGMSESWHTLGFEWVEKSPDAVYITVGAHGITNVEGVEFNADGAIVSSARVASVLTNYDNWSTRRFILPWDDFVRVANAKSVKMKVIGIDDYTVSSFGPANGKAIINAKMGPFLQAVAQLKAGEGA